jgi:hypothetical protein
MPRSSRKARIWLTMLAYQALVHAMQRLQVGCFGGNELHGWALDSFGDCFGVAEIVPVSFAIRFDVHIQKWPLTRG